MSDVTLTIDGRQVTVPTGTGLVEAAAALDIEIPVFCYEPRIGPAVGACRMCLVEIEGVPKLQAACATAVRPDMVVSTVSNKARDAQDAILEFLLLNHPLDCPVCDKGGECPLQDNAFRWGPGTSRFREQKRTGDKPIPVSPLVALDRERCILCYRCTRYSAEVTEDVQLVPRQRGANTVIATFEGRHWEGHHAGNVIELCPVGALTSTEYRFHGRPWEVADHPSIAPHDVLGTNIFNTVREGKVVRVLSRENADVDNGWLDDRTRFAYAAMYGPARITRAAERPYRERPAGNRPVIEQSIEVALEWLHDKLTAAAEVDGARELWVLSGDEPLEVVHAVQQLAQQTGGHVVAIPGASSAAPANTARIADLRTAQNVIVVGDADLLDIAPGLDLAIRKSRQRGAAVTVAGMGGTRLAASGVTRVDVRGGDFESLSIDTPPADVATVVVYREGELGAAALATVAALVDGRDPGSGVLAIPAAANARGLAALGVETATWDDILAHTGGVIYLGVDPARHVPRAQWGPSVKRAAWVVAVDALPTPLHEVADLVIPAAWGGECDGTLVNMEGRLQRMTVGATPPGDVRPQLRWIAGLARRLGANVPGYAAGAYRQLAERHTSNLPAASHDDIPEKGVLGVTGGQPYTHTTGADATLDVTGDELLLYVAPYLFDATDVRHSAKMQFLTERSTVTMHRDDARARGLRRGSCVTIDLGESYGQVPAVVDTTSNIAAGHARVHAGTGDLPAGRTGYVVARVSAATTAEVTA